MVVAAHHHPSPGEGDHRPQDGDPGPAAPIEPWLASYERDEDTQRVSVLHLVATTSTRAVDIVPRYRADGLIVAAEIRPL